MSDFTYRTDESFNFYIDLDWVNRGVPNGLTYRIRPSDFRDCLKLFGKSSSEVIEGAKQYMLELKKTASLRRSHKNSKEVMPNGAST